MTTERTTLHVNGQAREVPAGASVEDALRLVGRDPAVPGVAVAVNEAVVRRADWARTTLAAGDRVEVVTASQGG
jgi:thiamine biosynthesis protein ThiS